MNKLNLLVTVGDQTRELKITSDSSLALRTRDGVVVTGGYRVLTVITEGDRPDCTCQLDSEDETVIEMLKQGSKVSLRRYNLPSDPSVMAVEVTIHEPIDGRFVIMIKEVRLKFPWWPPKWMNRLPWNRKRV